MKILIPMVTTVGKTLTVHLDGLETVIDFPSPLGITLVSLHGNAVRLFWRFLDDEDWRGAMDIPVDDIGLENARVHPLCICEYRDRATPVSPPPEHAPVPKPNYTPEHLDRE